MRRGGLALPPMGGPGKIVEADETYYGDVPEGDVYKRQASSRAAGYTKAST